MGPDLEQPRCSFARGIAERRRALDELGCSVATCTGRDARRAARPVPQPRATSIADSTRAASPKTNHDGHSPTETRPVRFIRLLGRRPHNPDNGR